MLSSNETHSVKEFVSLAFQEAGIAGLWSGEGLDEKFRIFQENKILAEVNEEFYRPAEIDLLFGDSNPIREELGWRPQYSFQDLVKRMVNHDLKIVKKETFLKINGHSVMMGYTNKTKNKKNFRENCLFINLNDITP